MEEQGDLLELTATLARNWDIECQEGAVWAELKAALMGRLKELIAHDFERLVQAMYRMDVQESKFAAAMACSSVNEQAAALAEIVLERELQRLAFRKKYRQGGNGQT